MKDVVRIVAVVLAVLISGQTPAAQAPTPTPPAQTPVPTPPPQPQAASGNPISLKFDVSLSRFQGDRKVASLPFTLVSMGGNRASLRFNANVPTRTVTPQNTESVNYQSIGTNVDISGIAQTSDGRYAATISIADMSIVGVDLSNASRAATQPIDPAAIRTTSLLTSVLLRNGETLQFAVGADKITGETVKAEITLTVLK